MEEFLLRHISVCRSWGFLKNIGDVSSRLGKRAGSRIAELNNTVRNPDESNNEKCEKALKNEEKRGQKKAQEK